MKSKKTIVLISIEIISLYNNGLRETTTNHTFNRNNDAVIISSPSKLKKEVSKWLMDNSPEFMFAQYKKPRNKRIVKVNNLSTGVMSIDMATGIGGVPCGRIVEIFGPESQGKTTLALHLIAEAQKTGGLAAFIDAEHSLDVQYAKRIGVNIDDLLISQPDCGDDALELVRMLVSNEKMSIVVVDSVAALVQKEELENDLGSHNIALQARMMSKMLRSITSKLGNKSNTVVVFIKQVREKIGVVWGNPEDTTGGRALKFYASMRIDVRKRGSVKSKDEKFPDSIKCHLKVVKNKVAPPLREAEFVIRFGKGIDIAYDLVTYAINNKVIKKNGAFFKFGKNTFHGEQKLLEYFENEAKLKAVKLIVSNLVAK